VDEFIKDHKRWQAKALTPEKCDHEQITEEDCLLCCQGMQAYDANVSISSFHANLEYIRMELESDEEE
jgi:hypothetical protein